MVKNLLRIVLDDFRLSMRDSARVQSMPEITPEQIKAKHEAIVAARRHRTGKKKQLKPKTEIHTLIMPRGQNLYITVESNDIAEKIEKEAIDYGLLEVIRNGYKLAVREAFDVIDVGVWLGRDGIVEVFDSGLITTVENYRDKCSYH